MDQHLALGIFAIIAITLMSAILLHGLVKLLKLNRPAPPTPRWSELRYVSQRRSWSTRAIQVAIFFYVAFKMAEVMPPDHTDERFLGSVLSGVIAAWLLTALPLLIWDGLRTAFRRAAELVATVLKASSGAETTASERETMRRPVSRD